MKNCIPVEENPMTNSAYAQEVEKMIWAIGKTTPEVYFPSDDSYLMLDALEQMSLQGKRVLDVGTGSGILALFCALHGGEVTATDVNASALESTRRAAKALGLTIETILSDVFSKVRGRFDIVAFNPPYLPSSKIQDRAVDGGINGTTLSKRFLNDLANHLDQTGTALLLVSSLNRPKSLIEQYDRFQFETLARRSLFFEELQVLGIRFRENFAC